MAAILEVIQASWIRLTIDTIYVILPV